LSLTLRAKFLLLSALIPTLVVGLLIWNSLRLMNNAVSANAERVAQEYAVALNLTLSPYATSGRLPQLGGHLTEMLADPATAICAIWSSSTSSRVGRQRGGGGGAHGCCSSFR